MAHSVISYEGDFRCSACGLRVPEVGFTTVCQVHSAVAAAAPTPPGNELNFYVYYNWNKIYNLQ